MPQQKLNHINFHHRFMFHFAAQCTYVTPKNQHTMVTLNSSQTNGLKSKEPCKFCSTIHVSFCSMQVAWSHAPNSRTLMASPELIYNGWCFRSHQKSRQVIQSIIPTEAKSCARHLAHSAPTRSPSSSATTEQLPWQHRGQAPAAPDGTPLQPRRRPAVLHCNHSGAPLQPPTSFNDPVALHRSSSMLQCSSGALHCSSGMIQ